MKAIQIGVGGFGKRWIRASRQVSELELVAMVDVSEQALEEACNLGNYDPSICYTNLDDALIDVTADFLICVTPPSFHKTHAIRAMEAGLHVLCEKPLANTIDDCLDMLEFSLQSKRILAVAQSYRYRPDTSTLARLVTEGRIGTLGQVRLDFYKGWYWGDGDFRRQMPHVLLVDMSIHHFDLIRFITGREARTIQGVSWNPTWSYNEGDSSVAMVLELEGDIQVAYNASWCAQGDFCNWNGNWLIEGDGGSIRYQDDTIRYYKARGQYEVARAKIVRPEPFPDIDQEYLLKHFISSIEAGQLPQTHIADNIRSIGMVFAAVQAVESGEVVPVLSPEIEAKLYAYASEFQS